MAKKVTDEMIIKEMQKKVKEHLLSTRLYLGELTKVIENQEISTKGEQIVNVISVILSGQMTQIKRIAKKFEKNSENASKIKDLAI